MSDYLIFHLFTARKGLEPLNEQTVDVGDPFLGAF